MVPNITKTGTSFRGAMLYYLHDKREEGESVRLTGERVAWTSVRNLMADDPESAVAIMRATANDQDRLKAEAGIKNTGRKSDKCVYAYSLAWHPDEKAGLTRAEMERAADESIRAIGAQDLSYRVAEKGSYETVTLARSFNQMTAQLEEAEQLRQNLLADVAHELRTPLTVLQGNLRALLDDVYALDKSEVARLYDQTRHLSGLVNDLHELAQAEARRLPLAVERVDLSDVVRSATELVAPIAADREIRLEVDVPDAPVFAMADRARTMQILQNLLANALRHTHPGGAIEVMVASRAGLVDLAVRDTGDGIDPAQLPHIFDRFYRTDSARTRDAGGAGLGLAVVRALAEAQGGSVQATSAGLGEGATFRVTLPAG